MFSKDSHIVVIDDSESARTLITEQLVKLGYRNVLLAENGQEAIEKLSSMHSLGIQIQLIISDWNMPEMNGIELLRIMKKEENFKNIPFLMITSENDISNVMKAISLGVSDYVVKPFSDLILEKKIESIHNRIKVKNK